MNRTAAVVSLLALSFFASASAFGADFQGMITGRGGDTSSVKTANGNDSKTEPVEFRALCSEF